VRGSGGTRRRPDGGRETLSRNEKGVGQVPVKGGGRGIPRERFQKSSNSRRKTIPKEREGLKKTTKDA